MLRLFLICLALCPLFALAQFGQFFQNAFHGHHGHQQQQQQQQQQQREGHPGWQLQEQVSCATGYLCPGSWTCVNGPKDCPCPFPEDIKCALPDDSFVCVRGAEACSQAQKFSRTI